MSDLSELYQEVILDHYRKPRNFGELPDATQSREGFNPLCGDHLHVHLRMQDGCIQDIRFEGTGCAISRASASIMTTLLKGKTMAEAEALFERFHALVTADLGAPVDDEGLGRLAVFAGVRQFPARVKCASLAWHTMHAALEDDAQVVCTE